MHSVKMSSCQFQVRINLMPKSVVKQHEFIHILVWREECLGFLENTQNFTRAYFHFTRKQHMILKLSLTVADYIYMLIFGHSYFYWKQFLLNFQTKVTWAKFICINLASYRLFKQHVIQSSR